MGPEHDTDDAVIIADYPGAVRQVATQVMDDAQHVGICRPGQAGQAWHDISVVCKAYVPTEPRQWWGAPEIPEVGYLDEADTIVYETMAASVNFCYWYGRHDCKPGGASSTLMYQLLSEAWAETHQVTSEDSCRRQQLLDHFTTGMSQRRFPMLRGRHINLIEMFYGESFLDDFVDCVLQHRRTSVHPPLAMLVEVFMAFGDDVFLKRAQLLFHLLHQRFGWFPDIGGLTVPADYRVPAALRSLGMLEYSDALGHKVDTQVLLLSGCAEEVEIRAATILACDQIAKHLELTTSDVDQALWRYGREQARDVPFHLCVTTDY
jgi:hypothetical protein